MNLVMRKLALYEKYDAEQKTKLNITVTKPTDTKLIQNVQNILKKLNYSYSINANLRYRVELVSARILNRICILKSSQAADSNNDKQFYPLLLDF